MRKIITSGIVLYNPNIERLKENLDSISCQVDKVYLFNNGSKNISDISLLMQTYPNVVLINSDENIGIASALNHLTQAAENDGYKWIVTLDQDSVAPVNLISGYLPYLDNPQIGMLTCRIIDRNFGERIGTRIHPLEVDEVELCITSASALSIAAWKNVGGFCDRMFIDAVDFDMCLLLREAKYKIIRINSVKLLHEVGHSKIVHLFGKEELVFNHSPLRCYYMVRNNFLLGKRHHQLLRQVALALKRIILINLYEENHLNKNKFMLKGIWHALIGRYGKL